MPTVGGDPSAPVSAGTPPETAEGVAIPVATSAAPPVVRLPGGPLAEGTLVSASGPGEAAGAGDMAWRADSVRLRQPAGLGMGAVTLRSNRMNEVTGVLPRLTRPERRSFGGFLSGFANLFNPFAPTAQGVAGADTSRNWYDAQPNVAPLPRGFRDERTHEPTATLFMIGTDVDLNGEATAPAAGPAKPGAK